MRRKNYVFLAILRPAACAVLLLGKTGCPVPDNFLPVGLGNAVEVDQHVAVAPLVLLDALPDGVQSSVGEEIHLVEAAGEALHHFLYLLSSLVRDFAVDPAHKLHGTGRSK